ncbi:hypothetical protein [Corynebacterium guaraldiae]|uniref:hypothetical protein n=1 Tax=Corynebacterium guaraldiae TaxID=3051103 RepID=UPI0018A9D13E
MSNEIGIAAKFLCEKHPFSNSQVDKLGEFYAGKRSTPPDCQEEIISWYEWLKDETSKLVLLAVQTIKSGGLGPFEVVQSARVKTRSSIADKINRGARLSAMQDFAGVRFDLGATHSTLLDIAHLIEALGQQVNAKVTIKNYLSNPQRGYRAVHVWVTSKTAGRVEIQLRTQLQAEWANTFEKLADLTGRRIRYEDDYRPAHPSLQSILDNLLEISDKFYGIETDLEEGYESAQSGLQTITATSRAIPVDPRVHRKRAKFYMYMASYELELADTAESNNETLKSLRKLKDTLTRLPIESEQING